MRPVAVAPRRHRGGRIPIVHGTAFVPVLFDPADPGWTAAFKRYDQQALDTYRRLGLRVVPIQSTALVGFGGSVHCLTRQLPRLEWP